MQYPLSLLVGAAVLCYGGTHMVWRGLGGARTRWPMLRGAALAMPICVVAGSLALAGQAGQGVAVLLTGAVLLATLVLGVCAASAPAATGMTGTSLRLLAPVAAAMVVVGISGPLTVVHAIAIGSMTFALLWARPRQDTPVAEAAPAPMMREAVLLGAILLMGGAVALSMAVMRFLQMPIIPLAGPIAAPMALLAAIGLLAGDVHAESQQAGTSERAADTIVAGILTLLGFGLPVLILLAHALHSSPIGYPLAATQPTTQPSPSTPAILMPLATWRIDAVLLGIVSLFLLPVSLGRFTLGRLEGACLALGAVAYVITSVIASR
jgi:hypothetical protein